MIAKSQTPPLVSNAAVMPNTFIIPDTEFVLDHQEHKSNIGQKNLFKYKRRSLSICNVLFLLISRTQREARQQKIAEPSDVLVTYKLQMLDSVLFGSLNIYYT